MQKLDLFLKHHNNYLLVCSVLVLLLVHSRKLPLDYQYQLLMFEIDLVVLVLIQSHNAGNFDNGQPDQLVPK